MPRRERVNVTNKHALLSQAGTILAMAIMSLSTWHRPTCHYPQSSKIRLVDHTGTKKMRIHFRLYLTLHGSHKITWNFATTGLDHRLQAFTRIDHSKFLYNCMKKVKFWKPLWGTLVTFISWYISYHILCRGKKSIVLKFY